MERYRIYTDAAVYFVTYSVVEWLPVFVSSKTCRIITDSLSFCHREKQLRINAYVIMPTHLHLIVFDAAFDNGRLETTLAELRRYTGRQLSDYCIQHGPACFLETLQDEAGTDRERRFWQPSRHPVAIVSERFWMQKLDYLHDNPRRKGLVERPEYWRFSSAAWYLSDGGAVCDVPLSRLEW
jgi:REP element-mobilizing transposase RayT